MKFVLAYTGSGLLFALLLAVFFNIDNVLAKTGPQHDKIVVCYVSTWAVYRPGLGSYSIEDIDANLCTHLVYAFAGLDIAQSAIKSLDPWQDLKDEYGKDGYERMTNLKRSHPHLKVTLAIGGWNEGSTNYSIMTGNDLQRQKFVKQVTSFIRKYNFDGLDLDWEYPTQRGGSPNDRENFVKLTKELHEEFIGHNLILTSALGAAKHVIDQAYDIKEISKYLDFLHIMCYDYHGSWDKQIGYNAPLIDHTNQILSVQYSVDYLISLGLPPNKLVMGLPFYGRTFKTPLDGRIGDGTDGTNGFQGPYTREDGFLGYNEICRLLANETSGWRTTWDNITSQAIAYSERDKFDGMISVVTYDNLDSMIAKVKFASKRQLAGVMIWSIDTDDYRGVCGKADTINKKYPLLNSVNEALVLYADEKDIIDNEIPHGSVEDHKVNENNGCAVSRMLNIFSYLFIFILLKKF